MAYTWVIWAVCLLTYGHHRSANAFTIVSENETPVLNKNDSSLYSQNAVDTLFDAQGFDFGIDFLFTVTGSDGTISILDITSPAPQFTAVPVTYSYIPASGVLHVSDVDAVKNPIRFNSSEQFDTVTAQPTGRQLNGFSLKSFVKGFTCSGGFGTLGALAVGGADSAGANVCGGDSGISQEQLNAVNDRVDKMAKSAVTLAATETKLENSTEILFGDVKVLSHEIEAYAAANQAQVNNLQAQVNATNGAQMALAAQLTINHNIIEGQIGELNTQMSSLAFAMAQQAIQDNNNANRLSSQMADIVMQFNSRLQNLTNLLIADKQIQSQINRAGAINDRETISIFEASQLQTDKLIRHTVNIQKYIREDFAGGIYTPYLTYKGVGPAIDGVYALGERSSNVIDIINKGYVRLDPATNLPWATISTYDYRCGSVWFVAHPYRAVTSADVQEFMGPPGCSATVEGPNYCQCWRQWTEITCPMPVVPSTNIPDPTALASFMASTVINEAQHCNTLGSTIPFVQSNGGLDGVVDFVWTDHVASQAVIANRGAPMVTACYHEWDRTHQQPCVPWYVEVARGDYADMVIPTPDKALNIYHVEETWIVRRWQMAVDYVDTFQAQVFGVSPADLTEYGDEYQIDPQSGAPISTSYWAFMAFQASNPDDFLPVSVYQSGETVAGVVVTVNGVPHTQSSVTLIFREKDANYLFSNTVKVGDPFSATTEYDVPAQELPIGPNPRSRAGHITYVQTGDPSGVDFTPAVWQTVNGEKFNHLDGSETADIYLRTLDNDVSSPSFGLCVGTPTVFSAGDECIRRTLYQVLPNRGQNTVTLVSRRIQLRAQIVIPQGKLEVAAAGSSCPLVGKSVIAPGVIAILLTSQSNVRNTIIAQQFGGCSETYPTINIPPQGTVQLLVKFCAANPPGVFDQLFFFYQSPTGLKACATGVNITESPGGIGKETGSGSLNFTETLRTVTSDSILSRLSALEVSTADRLNKVVLHVTDLAGYNPIPVPSTFFNNSQALIQEFTDVGFAGLAGLNQSRNEQVDYNKLEIPFQERYDAAARNFTINNANAQAEVVALSNTAGKFDVDLTVFTRDSLANLAAQIAFQNDTVQVAVAVRDAIQAIHDAGGDSGNLFDGLTTFLTTIGGWTKEELGNALHFLETIPGAFAKFLETTLGAFMSGLGGAVLVFVALGLSGIAVLMVIIVCCKPPIPGLPFTAGEHAMMESHVEMAVRDQQAAQIAILQQQVAMLMGAKSSNDGYVSVSTIEH